MVVQAVERLAIFVYICQGRKEEDIYRSVPYRTEQNTVLILAPHSVAIIFAHEQYEP